MVCRVSARVWVRIVKPLNPVSLVSLDCSIVCRTTLQTPYWEWLGTLISSMLGTDLKRTWNGGETDLKCPSKSDTYSETSLCMGLCNRHHLTSIIYLCQFYFLLIFTTIYSEIHPVLKSIAQSPIPEDTMKSVFFRRS